MNFNFKFSNCKKVRTLFVLFWMLLGIAEVLGQVEMMPRLEPSDQPFQQMLYLSSQRDWAAADSVLEVAITRYDLSGMQDSVLLCQLHRAQIYGLSGSHEERKSLVNKIGSEIERGQRPNIDLFYQFLLAEIAFDDQEYQVADSLYDKALKYGDSNYGACYEFKPKLYLGKAIIAYYHFRLQEIYQFAKDALHCNRLLYSDDDIRHSSILNLMGAACYEMQYFEEAIQHYQKALEISQTSSSDQFVAFNLIMNIGNAQVKLNKFQLAISSFEEALTLVKQDSNLQSSVGMVYFNLASCLYAMGYYSSAKEYAEEALHFSEQMEPRPPYLSFILNLLGKCYGKLDDLQNASKYLEQNYEFLQSVYGPDYQGLPYAMNAHALVLYEGKDIEKSLAMYEQIFRMIENQDWNPNDVDRASYLERAGEYALTNNNYTAALDYFHRAIKDYSQSSGSQQLNVSQSFVKLANFYLGNEQMDSARYYLQLAIETLLPTHQDAKIEDLVLLNDWANVEHLENIISTKVAYRMASYSEKAQLSELLKGKEEIDQVMQLISPKYGAYFDKEDLAKIIDQFIVFYEQAIAYYTLLYDLKNNQDYLYKALSFLEETKDISQKIAGQSSDQQLDQIVDAVVLQEEEYIIANIKRLREELFATDPHADTDQQVLRDSLFTYKRRLDLFQARLSTSNPQYYSLKYKVAAPDFNRIHQYANLHQCTILNFFWGVEDIYVFVVNKEGISYQKLCTTGELDELLLQAQESLRQFKETTVFRTLFEKLLSPIKDQLRTDRLVVIPDGRLHFLPFEALQTATGFLLEEKTIWYAHSLDHLLSKSHETYQQELLSLAPGFSDELKQELVDQLGVDQVTQFTKRLYQPNALQLTKSLAEDFSGTYLLENEATEHNFRSNIRKQGIIHLATHAHVDDHHPMYSRFSLVPTADGNEGFLHAYEIVNLPLQADLAVLPACESGVGRIHRGEGVTSLSYAFRATGCNNVLMSLWMIDEQQSMHIISKFYVLLKEGYSAADALAGAKREYLETAVGPLRNPAYWAGLVLAGNGMHPAPRSTYIWYLGGLLFLGILWVLHKRKSNRDHQITAFKSNS